ncbi:glycoprotein A33 (transmembrane), paralog a [Echeneis naucrates]|uniref:Cell surface A33 antigen-like n=1 Tax=Echeneis naucrates TaxID=173247 RepID=A0A665WYB9_ECHNA|nr:cell surface A33 antigen-like [Echeneis naucrates]
MKALEMEGGVFRLTLLCVLLSGVGAVIVTIDKETYEHARGDNITIPCRFTPSITINAQTIVVITWSVEGTEADAEETGILTHFYGRGTDIKKQYEGRVALDVDVPSGKADLKLSSITLEDNKEFKCHLLIRGDDEGTPYDTARLVVLVAPSTPICKIEGKTEYGQNINLTCRSEEGSPPPTYKWESRDVRNMPQAVPPRTTDRGGIMSLYNISKETSGYYICTSSNKIRSATCNVTLAVMPPSMNIGSTAGIIGGVVALLIILIIIIYCCCCRKKKKDEEYAMGVREDEYRDTEPAKNTESPRADGEEDLPVNRNDQYGERSERSYDRRSDYDDRRSDYDDRRRDYDDRRRDYDDRRSDYDDRRSDYNDRRRDYDDRRSDYDDRRSDYDDRRSDYDDRHDRNNGRNADNYRRDRRDDDQSYDNRIPNKPPRTDYDD